MTHVMVVAAPLLGASAHFLPFLPVCTAQEECIPLLSAALSTCRQLCTVSLSQPHPWITGAMPGTDTNFDREWDANRANDFRGALGRFRFRSTPRASARAGAHAGVDPLPPRLTSFPPHSPLGIPLTPI
ncbi:hypothetical protein B0H11DRAFT_354929 [Mycena galericulata]|nr:hypothetical protein B0H11DRAFT_354929 [Mycena galericulata]